jgi:serine/threonine-protein kinase
MDYVDGTDAARLVRNRYPAGMPRDEALEIVAGIAEALDFAHQRGLLHRDVKPANILIAHQGGGRRRVLLADFGIARNVDDSTGLTATNMTLGTVSYAAPEQLSGDPLDGRADEYALAATAYHLLTGTPPFEHSNPAVVIGKHLNAPPPKISAMRPDLADLDPVFERALAKRPESRFASCQDFAVALSGARSTSGVATAMRDTALAAAPVHTPRQAAPRNRSSTRLIALGAVAAALFLALMVFLGVQLSNRNPESTSGVAESTLVKLTPRAPLTDSLDPTATPTRPIPTTGVGRDTGQLLLPDADGLGFLSYGGSARCNAGEWAEFVLRTQYSAVVICGSPAGQLTYRGLRLSDGATIHLDDVRVSGSGFVALNSSEGAQYEVSHAGLRIVQYGQVLATEPAVEAAP